MNADVLFNPTFGMDTDPPILSTPPAAPEASEVEVKQAAAKAAQATADAAQKVADECHCSAAEAAGANGHDQCPIELREAAKQAMETAIHVLKQVTQASP